MLKRSRRINLIIVFQMASRYFFRTFHRLFLLSSSRIPVSIRNQRLTAAVIGTAAYKTSTIDQFTRSFIVHAKSLVKDLLPTGNKKSNSYVVRKLEIFLVSFFSTKNNSYFKLFMMVD